MLTEDQIQRFARQILLKPVGGKGQEKLCAAEAIVSGDGLAAEIAALYLEAGGTPVHRETNPSPMGEGARRADEGAAELQTVAVRPGPHGHVIAAFGPLTPETSVLAGALAALIYQRHVLGLGPPPAKLTVGADGSIS